MSDYSSNFPQQRPTLNLDFANSGKLDSRISYARSSSATAFSAERHLSSENLITQSQFSGWSELVSPTVTAAYTNGPDGSSNTATRLQSASGANRFFYSTATSWTSGQQYTVSCWVKSNTGVAQTFAFFLPTTAYATADLTTHASDWTRITATFTAATSSIYCGFKLLSANTTDLSIWGFQVNTGANALDYQATSGQIHREFAPTLKTSAANEPRFEYATDGQSEGLLIEQQKSNLALNSNDFTNATWNKQRVTVTPSAAIGPDGQLSASLIAENTDTTTIHFMLPIAAITSGYSVGTDKSTHSVFAKYAGRNLRMAEGYNSVDGGATIFDLQNGTVVTGGGSIQSCGNGWYRCSITVTMSASALLLPYVQLVDGTTWPNASDAGDGYSGILLFGLQTEQQSMSSYITTGSSAVTKSADSCSVVDATLFSSGEHTIIWEGDLNATTVDARMANLTDGSINNRIRLDYDNGSSARLFVEADDVVQANVSYTTDLSVGSHKVAGTLKTNEAQLIVDGTRRQLDTSAVAPSGLDQLAIMKTFYSSSNVHDGSGHCKRLTYYNVALSQTEAESLTSNP